MIVHDLDVFSACGRPTEAHPELIVHTNAVLAGTIAFQGLHPVAGRYPQIVQSVRDLQLPELASCDGRDVRKTFDPLPS